MDDCDTEGLWRIERIDAALSHLRWSRHELQDCLGRARAVASSMDWEARAARAFHDRLEDLLRDIAVISDDVEAAAASLSRERRGILLSSPGWCP